MGLGAAPSLGRPFQWVPPAGQSRAATLAALVAATEDSWKADMLAGLADTGTTLADGTELFVGSIAFAGIFPAARRWRPP